MGAFVTASIIAAVIEIPFSMSIGDNPTALQTVISILAEYLIMLISQVLSAGVLRVHLGLTRGENVRVRNMFDTFRYGFDRYFIGAVLLSLIVVIAFVPFGLGMLALYFYDALYASVILFAVGCILTAILAIYVTLTYNFIYFFLADHPDMRPVAALRESRHLMKHNKARFFGLLISFIGYGLLTACSFGIAALWISPYLTESLTIFYLDSTGELDYIPIRTY
jgi:uncharacterized membrane protein